MKPTKPKPPKGRPATIKRAKLPRRSDYSLEFVKAWKRYENSGRVDLNEVKLVMNLIVSNEGPLPAEFKDHALKGELAAYRECHVRNNHLLIYKLVEKDEAVIFTDMGTHAELFGR